MSIILKHTSIHSSLWTDGRSVGRAHEWAYIGYIFTLFPLFRRLLEGTFNVLLGIFNKEMPELLDIVFVKSTQQYAKRTH